MKKCPPSKVSRQLKKAGIVGGIAIRKNPWESDKPKGITGMPKDKPPGERRLNQLPKETLILMAKDKASGLTDLQIADKYSVSNSYIQGAMRTLFMTSKIGREILKGVLLDNAVACGMRVRATVDELSPMQAVIATGVMTQRFVELEKHTQQAPPDVDFSELAQVGQILKDIRGSIGLIGNSVEGEIIDIQADVQPPE